MNHNLHNPAGKYSILPSVCQPNNGRLLIEQLYSKTTEASEKNTISPVDDLTYTRMTSCDLYFDTVSSIFASCYDDIPVFHSDLFTGSESTEVSFCQRVLNGEIPFHLNICGPTMSFSRFPFIDCSLIVSGSFIEDTKSTQTSLISLYNRSTLRSLSIFHRNFLAIGPLAGKSRECHRLDLRLRFIFYQLVSSVQCLHTQGIMLESLTADSVSVNSSLWLSLSPALAMNLNTSTNMNKSIECHINHRILSALYDADKCIDRNQRMIARISDDELPNIFKPLKILWIALVRLENELKRFRLQDDLDHLNDTSHEVVVPLPPSPASWYTSIAERWMLGEMTNWEYLLRINHAAGRSLQDSWFHPILPWVSDFSEQEGEKSNHWRKLSISKFRANKGDHQLDLTFEYSQPPHHVPESLSELTYCIYMARKLPISVLRDVVRSDFIAEHYPSSMQRMYKWTPDECIPEFFNDASVFRSTHKEFGMNDIELPQWCATAEDFIVYHRRLLESPKVSVNLHMWIDLLFGVCLSSDYPQRGKGSCAIRCKNVPLGQQTSTSKLTDFPKHSGFVQVFGCPHPKRLIGSNGEDLELFSRLEFDAVMQKTADGAKEDARPMPSYVLPSPFGSAVLSLNDSLRASTITLAMTPLVSTAPIAETKPDMFDYILSSSASSASTTQSSAVVSSSFSIPTINIGINSSSLITTAVGAGDSQVPVGAAFSAVSQSVSQRNFMSLNSPIPIAPHSNSYKSVMTSTADLKRSESLLNFARSYDAVLDSPTFNCGSDKEPEAALKLWHAALLNFLNLLLDQINEAKLETLKCMTSSSVRLDSLTTALSSLSRLMKLSSSIFHSRKRHLQSEDMIRVGLLLGQLYSGHSPITDTALTSLMRLQDVLWLVEFDDIISKFGICEGLNLSKKDFRHEAMSAVESWNCWLCDQVDFSLRQNLPIKWYNDKEIPWYLQNSGSTDDISPDSSSQGFLSALGRLKTHKLCKIGPVHIIPPAIRSLLCKLLDSNPQARLSCKTLLESTLDKSFHPNLNAADDLRDTLSSTTCPFFALRSCSSIGDSEVIYGAALSHDSIMGNNLCKTIRDDLVCVKSSEPNKWIWRTNPYLRQSVVDFDSIESLDDISESILNPKEEDVADFVSDCPFNGWTEEEELSDCDPIEFELSNFFPSYFGNIYAFDFDFFASSRVLYFENKRKKDADINNCVEFMADMHFVENSNRGDRTSRWCDDSLVSRSQSDPTAISVVTKNRIRARQLELCHKRLISTSALPAFGLGLVLPAILFLMSDCACLSVGERPYTFHRVSAKIPSKIRDESFDSDVRRLQLTRNRCRLKESELNILSFCERSGTIADDVYDSSKLYVFRIAREVYELSCVKQALRAQNSTEKMFDSWTLSTSPREISNPDHSEEKSTKNKSSDDVLKRLVDKYVELVSLIGGTIRRDLSLKLLIPCVHGFIVSLQRPKAIRMLLLSNLWSALIDCGTPREFVRRFVPFMIDLLLTGLVERTEGESTRFKRLQPAASMAVASLASPACLGPALTARYLLPRLAVAINSPASLYHPSRMDISAARFAVHNSSQAAKRSSERFSLNPEVNIMCCSGFDSCSSLSDSCNDFAIWSGLNKNETVVVRLSSSRLFVSRQQCESRTVIASSNLFFTPFLCPIYSCGGNAPVEAATAGDLLTLTEESVFQAKSIGDGFLRFFLQKSYLSEPLISIESGSFGERNFDCSVEFFDFVSDIDNEDLHESGDEDLGESFEPTNFCLVRALVGIGQQLCEAVISPLILEGLIADKLLKSVKAVSNVVTTCSEVCMDVSSMLLKLHCSLGNKRQSQSLARRSQSEDVSQIEQDNLVDSNTATMLVDCVNRALTALDINPAVLCLSFGFSSGGISVDLSSVEYSPTTAATGVFLSVPFCPPDSAALYSSTTPIFLALDNLYENETLIRDLLMILTPKTVTRILFQTESSGFVQSVRLVPGILEATRWFGQVIDSIDEFRYAHFHLRVASGPIVSDVSRSSRKSVDVWKNALARLGIIRKILFRELLRLHSLASVITRTFYTACHFVGNGDCVKLLQAEIAMLYGAMAHIICPNYCSIPSSVAFVVPDTLTPVTKNWLGSRSQSTNADKSSMTGTYRHVLYAPLPVRSDEKSLMVKKIAAKSDLHDDTFFVAIRVMRELQGNLSEWVRVVPLSQVINLPNSVITKLDNDVTINLEFSNEFLEFIYMNDDDVTSLERKSLFCRMLSPSRYSADMTAISQMNVKAGDVISKDQIPQTAYAITLASDDSYHRFTAIETHIRDDSLTIVADAKLRIQSRRSSARLSYRQFEENRNDASKADVTPPKLSSSDALSKKSPKTIKSMFGKGLNWISKKHNKLHSEQKRPVPSAVMETKTVKSGQSVEEDYGSGSDSEIKPSKPIESSQNELQVIARPREVDQQLRISKPHPSPINLKSNTDNSPKFVSDATSPTESVFAGVRDDQHRSAFSVEISDGLMSQILVEEDYFSSRPSNISQAVPSKISVSVLKNPKIRTLSQDKQRVSTKVTKRSHWKFLSPISSSASFSPLPSLPSIYSQLPQESYLNDFDDIDQSLMVSTPFISRRSSLKPSNQSSVKFKGVSVMGAAAMNQRVISDKNIVDDKQLHSALALESIKKLLAAVNVNSLFYFSPGDGSSSTVPIESVDIAAEEDDATANDRTWLMSGASRIGALRAKIESLDTLSFGFTIRCQFEACVRKKPIKCIVVNDTESLLASCTASHGIRLWDLRHHPIHHAESFPKSGEGLYDTIHTIIFGDNNRKLLSCSSQDGIEVWDLKQPSKIPLYLLNGPTMSIPNAGLAACLIDRVPGLSSLRKMGPYSWMTQNDLSYQSLYANQVGLSLSSVASTTSISPSSMVNGIQSQTSQVSNGFSAMEIVGLGDGIDFGYEETGSFDQILAAYADGIQVFDLRESSCRCVAQWQFSDLYSAEPESLLDKGIFSSKPISTIGFPGTVKCLKSILSTDLVAAGSSSGHVALVDKRVGGRVVQSWQAHDSSILKMHSTKSGQLVTLSSDASSCIWNCASSQLTPCYSLDQTSFYAPVERLSSIKGLPDSQGLLSSSSSCLVPLHRQDDDENDFLSSLIRHGDAEKSEYGFDGINKPVQPYRDSVDDSTQFNEFLFVVSGHKLVSTMLSTTIDSSEAISLSVPNELKLDKIYFHDKFGSKFSRQKLSAHSVQILPLRKLMLLGCDDGNIRICT